MSQTSGGQAPSPDKKPKIIAIVGSLRKGSYNRMVFNTYKSLFGDRADIVEGKINELPVYDDDVREAGPPVAAAQLAQQVRDADGVIFFSPEYNYSVPTPLKNAIDWLSKLPPQGFAAKPVTIVSASPGKLGGARMQYHLRQIGVFLDMRFLNRPEVMISEVHKKVSPEGELTDEDTRKHLGTHFDTFLTFIQNTKA